MGRPLLLDLFCCEGGAGMGYHRAGFEVVGVDITPQPRYPFTFIQADALAYLWHLIQTGEIAHFKGIHLSPPCQEYSTLKSMKTHQYPDLLIPACEAAMASGLPWVLENVATAKMAHGLVICGTALGLNVRRHRRFDSSHLLWSPGACRHHPDNVNVYGHGVWNYRQRDEQHKHWQRQNSHQCPLTVADGRAAFETDWMTQHGMAECIPPAYTEYIGRQLLAIIDTGEAA